MFYKTEHGAFVGALLLSLIATCQLAKKNPIFGVDRNFKEENLGQALPQVN